MRIALALLAAALLLSPAQPRADACGAAPETPCEVADGIYRIALPEGVEHPPAMLFLHGWGGSADGVMANAAMIGDLTRRGYAMIAPDGIVDHTAGKKSWDVLRRPGRSRDDTRFLREVVEDAADRHGVDRDRILLAGFSNGGTMVWNVACLAPGLVRAYAAVSGALWEPMPEHCTGPVDLFHVHGWTDRVVPLEGRPLGGGAIVQGDFWKSLALLREAGGCTNLQPDTATAEGDIWQRDWTECAGGSIHLRLHPGGHMIPEGWVIRALDWFEALPRRDCLAADSAAANGRADC